MGTTQSRKTDHQRVVALMKEMGSKSGFDPIPPDQHAWTMQPGQAPLYRIWGWMCAHTIHWGHRSPFAVSKDGDELHMANIAADLGMAEAGAYPAWNEGVRLGLWRNGTKAEGKRRLYLCGEVVPRPEDESNPEDPENCLYKQFSKDQLNEFNRLPTAVRTVVDRWQPERLGQFLTSRVLHTRVREVALAEVVAAGRLILDQIEDTEYQAWGLEKNRQVHTPRLPPEELAERHARLPKLLPVMELCVQTISVSVQGQMNGSYNTSNGHVQSDSDDPILIEKSLPEKAKGVPSSSTLPASLGPPATQDWDGKKSVKQVPTPTTPDRANGHAQTSSKTAQAKAPDPEEAMQVAKALELDLDAAGQILSGARKVDPRITAREIVHVALMKLNQIRARIQKGEVNVPGFLIGSIPKAVLGGLRDAAREKARRDVESDIGYARLVIADEMASPQDKEREMRSLELLEAELTALGPQSQARDRERVDTAAELKDQLSRTATSKGFGA